MRSFLIRSFLMATITMSGSVVHAQQQVEFRFDATVLTDPGDLVRIRQPDDTTVLYIGDAPAHPYSKGDLVSFDFQATLPDADYFAANPDALDANGQARVKLFGPNTHGGEAFGRTKVDVKGPIDPITPNGQLPGLNGITAIWDNAKGSYSLAFPEGRWKAGTFDGPGFLYDPSDNSLTPVATTCAGGDPRQCDQFNRGGFALKGDENTVEITGIPIYSVPDADIGESTLSGVFRMLFSGEWSLPVVGNSSGGGEKPTPVPEPSTLLLFGTAAAGVAWRRRTRKRR